MSTSIEVGTRQTTRVNEALYWTYSVIELYDNLAFCTVTDREGHTIGFEICRIVDHEGKNLLQQSPSGHLVRQTGESITPLSRSEAHRAWDNKVAGIEKMKQQEAEARERQQQTEQRFSHRAMILSALQTKRYEARGKLKAAILACKDVEEVLSSKTIATLAQKVRNIETLTSNI